MFVCIESAKSDILLGPKCLHATLSPIVFVCKGKEGPEKGCQQGKSVSGFLSKLEESIMNSDTKY